MILDTVKLMGSKDEPSGGGREGQQGAGAWKQGEPWGKQMEEGTVVQGSLGKLIQKARLHTVTRVAEQAGGPTS